MAGVFDPAVAGGAPGFGVVGADCPPGIHPQFQLHPQEVLALGLFLDPPAAAPAAPAAPVAANLLFDSHCGWYLYNIWEKEESQQWAYAFVIHAKYARG